MTQISKWQFRWLGLTVAFALVLVAVLPSLQVWRARGGAWAENDPSFSGDEVAYCAYVNALRDGRPRRNDPYTGRDDAPGAVQHESLFSIQFIPPYLLAMLAGGLGLTASQVFLALNFLVPFAAAWGVFWLLYGVQQDARQAAAGTVVVLCLGSLALLYGPARALMGWDTTYTFAYLPFMRRYVPAVPFPVFWAFGACVWRALAGGAGEGEAGRVARRRLGYAALAGLLFGVLVFSYFYLWTAALAWCALAAGLQWLGRPAARREMQAPLAVILLLLAAALVPYGWLVLHRAPTMDSVQLLALSHAPDWARSSVKLGLLVMLALAWGVRRGRIVWRDPRVLWAAACTLAPWAMFNQQILTGRSLQPLHYEMYVAKYLALMGLWLTAGLLARGLRQRAGALAAVALVAWGWGVAETTIVAQRYIRNYPQANAVRPVAERIQAQQAEEKRAGVATVLYPDLSDADYAPTHTAQAVLWSPHLPAFAGVTEAENKERLYQFMYYTGVTLDGVDENNFEQTDPRTRYLLHSLIEWALNEPSWTVNWQPLQPAKIRAEITAYRDYISRFSRDAAARHVLAYVVTSDYAPADLSRLDLWYVRTAGEKVGTFTVYRVQLR